MNKPKKISEAENFWQLIQRTSKPLFDVLFNDGIGSALDVGYKDALPLMVLYHQYNYSKLVGIDSMSEEEITKEYRLMDHPEVNSIFGYYKNEFIVPAGFPNPKIEEEEEFSTIIDLRKISMDTFFLNPPIEKYDLIILSNILHYAESVEQAKKMLEGVKSLLHEHSKIYIRIKSKDWITVSLDEWTILINTILEGYSIQKYVNNKTHEGESLTFTNLPDN